MKKFLISLVVAVAMTLMPMVAPVWADCGGVATNLINCDGVDTSNGQAITYLLMIVLNILSGLVVTAALAGIVIAGVQYLTARDNDAQVVKAKNRILQIVIGLVVYALMWAFLNWLVPGGIFN